MWIQESITKGKKMRDHFNLAGVDVFIKDVLPESIDVQFVFEYISSRIPFFFMTGIDIIYIGYFPEMKEREVNAYFEDGAIYVTNKQDDEMDMIEDIIHEIAHAVETNHQEFIYSTGVIQREFVSKRQRLEPLLSQSYNVPSDFVVNFEYDEGIDDFLFRDVGYDALEQIAVNIFQSPYSITSVREYWAKGFEELFIGDQGTLRAISPVLYKVLISLVKELADET
jgi:hypothetical protein